MIGGTIVMIQGFVVNQGFLEPQGTTCRLQATEEALFVYLELLGIVV